MASGAWHALDKNSKHSFGGHFAPRRNNDYSGPRRTRSNRQTRRHCPAFLLKPSIGVSRMVVSSGMHSFRSQQVAAQDLFTMNGIHAARKTAEIAPEMPEKTFR